ncbi:MAG: chromate efflux transporter [Bdellovibrionales bacterium]|nr:chromate efflux transporter [Bdellovibrionales bacterium]
MHEAKPLSTVRPSIFEIAVVFARIGITAFGGPAAHIAMMETEIVSRRGWISQEEFLDLLSATNLIPGPNSTEMAIHIGRRMAGWRGLVVAGASFIGPAFLIVWAISWFYMSFSSLPSFQSIFIGVKPVILAVVAQAIWSLSKTAIRDRVLALFAALALTLYLVFGNELLILLLIAILNLLFRLELKVPRGKSFIIIWVSSIFLYPWIQALAQAMEKNKVAIEDLFGYFLKVGSVLFGSGYVLIAFLQSDLVYRYHWVTKQHLVDAIAVGQFTPGPVFSTATFIGYVIAGHKGAVVATIGIFLPAFLFVGLSAPLIPALRRSAWTAPILDGLNMASLSLMAGAALILAKGTINSVYGALVFGLSLILLVRFKINSAWLILIAGLLGFFNLTN